MKKIIITLCLALVISFNSSIIFASEIDLSSYSDEDLIGLLQSVQQEIVDRKIEKSATLEIGRYIGGSDIPAGSYTLSKGVTDTYGTIYLQTADNEQGKHKVKLYENAVRDQEVNFYLNIEEGDVLTVPWKCTLTVSAGIKFE